MFLVLLSFLFLSVGLNSGISVPCAEVEIWAECISPCNTCEKMGHCSPPPECHKGCDCKPGYFRNETGVCVPKEKCHPVKLAKCPLNAQFSSCGSPVFPTCDNPYPIVDYVDQCLPGCFCNPGFLMSRDGTCVPEGQCLEKEIEVPYEQFLVECREDEDYYECSPSCRNTCENFNNPEIHCECGPPGCFCKEGLVLREDGMCVPPEECPEPVAPIDPCREYEDYYECSPSCKNTCENFYNPEARCECGPPGCFCKQGLVLRADGRCVQPQECPQPPAPKVTCRTDEDYYECSPSCKNTCENFTNPGAKCQCGPPGCFCRRGLVLRADGRCVRPQECPKPSAPKVVCGHDEEYYECNPKCRNTCENFNNPEQKCQCGAPGCFCRQGLVLRADGRCVRPEECRKPSTPKAVCREDEDYYECNPSCRNTCENMYNQELKCECGPPGCFCREGLVLRADGRCVQPQECPKPPAQRQPPPRCPKNAIYIECGSPCPPTCEDLEPEPCEEKCVQACYCKPGYVKRKDGICVKIETCLPRRRPELPPPPPKCPENAIFIECGSPCPPTCENRYPTCEEKCTTACYCKPGYLKSKQQGKCVRADQCEPPPVIERCGVDEEYYQCTPSCKNTCENFRNPTALCQCGPPGCFCKKGLVMRADGKCVRPNQCPVQCGRDEQYYTCTPSCKNTCENCTNPAAICSCGPPGCFCREGLVKRADGKCVSPSQCPKRCGVDEEFYQCTPSCKNTCKHFRNRTAVCQCGPPGCFCKRGLVKRADGKCVPPNQCPVQCGRDEQYYNCTPSCKNTCENCDNPAAICTCGPPGCFCREGLVKRADGKCVPPSQCPKKCAVDEEFYQCTPNCKNTCENIQNPTTLCQCGPPGCFCKRGLVKRADGKCVPPNQCPAKCGKDEQYYQCTPSCKSTCENFHNPRVRCRCGPPGCFCREGLVRRADGKCVSPNQCPARCGVDEQYYQCTPTCKSTCDNFANLSIPCSCGPPGCSCKKGLIRRGDGKCVRPNQCPVKCAADEQYYTCTPLCKNTCENFDNPGVRCQCGPPGCFCRAGLVRRADGKCVLPNQCPVKCGANERYYQCTPSCKNTCENFNKPGVRCQCGPPGCFCRDGLVRRSDGRCIIPSQCPAKCGVDEEYYLCPPSCKNTCENYTNPNVQCQCGPPGCFCKRGLVKTEEGRCVNPTQCIKKPSKCQENAEYLTCGPSCRPTCKNPYTGSCPIRCVPGCFCKPGFVESHDGRCVHLERCEKRCQYPEEEFQECGTTCPETCENRGHPHPDSCPFRCNRGCFCKKGLVRTKEGTCVPLSDCSGSTIITPAIVGPIRIQPHPVPAPRFLPDDCYGCPDRSQCSIHCRSQGSYTGICVGNRQLHCKCL